jgi:hypothetical protein
MACARADVGAAGLYLPFPDGGVASDLWLIIAFLIIDPVRISLASKGNKTEQVGLSASLWQALRPSSLPPQHAP